VVSYNVHALPGWAVGDDPAGRMPSIGALLAGYDVALVQESWLHGTALAESAGLPTRIPGNASRSALLGRLSFFCGSCGSGLLLLLRLPAERVVAQEARPYGLCADWLVSGNDCWATKGFVFARVRLASGAEVDVYDTHLEAGDQPDDLDVRKKQLEELAAFVSARSAGRAVVLGGDLNLPFDDPEQREAVLRFARALELRDTGARPETGSPWSRRLDWILSRDGRDVALRVLEAGEDRAFVRDGAALSDHPALFARFRVRRID
jgi:endonuclease/exonuclease/phosphatase family metal-dependent hydrolase